MAAIFVLGPSEWRNPASPWDERLTPLEARRAIALALRRMEIPAILMEDEPGPADEAWQGKFFRLLEEHGVTDILFYWPPQARIDAAQDELIMLAVQERVQPRLRPRVALFGHVDAICEGEADGGMFLDVKDDVGRSSYLGQIPRLLPTDLHGWSDHDELFLKAQDWARAMFPDHVPDELLANELAPLRSVLRELREC